MAESESRRLAFYHGLNELLGPDLTDFLMTYLPSTPTTEFATKSDVADLGGEVSNLRDEVRLLSQRFDRLQTTLLGGFAAMIAALLAAGFLS